MSKLLYGVDNRLSGNQEARLQIPFFKIVFFSSKCGIRLKIYKNILKTILELFTCILYVLDNTRRLDAQYTKKKKKE